MGVEPVTLCSGQNKVADKSNEITAIPELLDRKRWPGPTFRVRMGGGTVPSTSNRFDITFDRKLDRKLSKAADALVDVRRIEVITSTGRRWRWSGDDKAALFAGRLSGIVAG